MKMKIAYLINQYPKISHSFIRREIVALEAQGIEIYRYSVRRSPDNLVDSADQLEQEKTNIILKENIIKLFLYLASFLFINPKGLITAILLTIKMGKKSHRGILRHFAYLAEASYLCKSLKQKQIHHIHAHFGTNSTTVALLCNKLSTITYSFTVHGPEEFDQPYALSLEDKIKNALFVIAISSYGKSQLYRWCSQEEWSKIHIIHCGLEPSFFMTKSSAITQNNQLVCVGRLCEQKGQLLLIETIKKLKDIGILINLVLVGDGEMRDVITQKIEDYQLTEQIKITGWANSEQVKTYLLESCALILPSFAEGLPVVIMEAFALNRPVISTYIAGIPELVEPNQSGWLVPAGSISDLVKVIQVLVQKSTESLINMGRVGNKQVKKYHDINVESKKLLQLFESYVFLEQSNIQEHKD